MPLSFPRPLVISYFVAGLIVNPLLAADAAKITVWKLDQPASVAGVKAEVLGEPKVQSDTNGKYVWFNGKTDGFIL
ncbi:MAG TPA: hypothetical protein VKC60_18715, partial [Opitutaceae bacterium]|nr:hypothetical protein [Opitutaceae bacterium]